MNDLFGDSDSEQEIRPPGRQSELFGDSGSEKNNLSEQSDNEKNSDNANDLFGEDSDVQNDDTQDKVVQDTVVHVKLPVVHGPKDNPNLFLLKLPNFLAIEPRPFDPIEFKQLEQESEKELDLAATTIRWRHDPKNKSQESNARLVRWSDNSYSLLVGDEMFDVGTTNVKDRHLFLTTQHQEDAFLQNQARFSQFMSFTPFSTMSSVHKKLMKQVGQKHQKRIKTKEYTVLHDPEALSREAEKAENERLKAKRKEEAKNSRQNRLQQESLYGEDVYSRGDRDLRNRVDEYEDDFVVSGEESEFDEQEEEERESRLMSAKKAALAPKSPPPEEAKVDRTKRRRVIEDSDDD